MRVAILRREPQFSFSMNVYANGVAKGLKKVRPDWEILELMPKFPHKSANALSGGLQKYYHRYWHYPRSFSKVPADIYHVIDHSDAHLVYWLKKFNAATVVTCHDLINLVHPETFRGKSRFPLISMKTWKWAIRGMEKADRVIAVSRHTAKDITKYFNHRLSEIAIIPNAVDTKFHCLKQEEIQAFRQKHNLTAENFYLLNVGSNNARKNVFTVLKVLAQLKKQGLNIYLWKAGTSFDREQQAFIKTNDLEQNIKYWGEPDDETLIKLYNAADVLVAPSLYEGFGMTILEAMACGTPVITSNRSSLPEVAGSAAILTEPRDLVAIETAILQLRQSVAYRQTLIDKGLERVKQFTWELTAEKVACVYEQLCQTGKV